MSTAVKLPAFGVVILGAGASSRMGRPKLLLPWKDTTIVGHLIRQWRELGAGQIAVVCRPNDEELVEAVKCEALNRSAADTLQRFNASTLLIPNPQPERGMFSSIVCAAEWGGWKPEIGAWAIVLGDQPHLRLETLCALLEFHSAHADAICQPEFDGRARHPVILPRRAFDGLKGSAAGTLEIFLKRIPLPRVQCVINDDGLALDLDAPEDYKRASTTN